MKNKAVVTKAALKINFSVKEKNDFSVLLFPFYCNVFGFGDRELTDGW